MKKCSSCGTENADEQKFCSECGAKLDEGDKACPSCGAHNPPAAKFCGNCGARLVVQAGVCPACGKQNAVDAKFCADCGSGLSGGAPVKASAAAPAPAAPRAAQPEKSKASGAEKVAAFKSKVTECENKHHLFVNLAVLVIALVVMFVALFAPVKVMAYYPEGIMPTDMEYSAGREEVSINLKGHYLEVSQPFWRVFAAAGYLALDLDDANDIKKIESIIRDYETLVASVSADVAIWVTKTGESDTEKISKKTEEILADKLSSFNYLGFEVAYQAFQRLKAEFDGEIQFKGEEWTGVEGSARITIIISLVIVSVMFAVAAMALAFLISAIVGMVKNKTMFAPYAMLKPVLITMTVLLCLEVLSPMLKAGGGVFAVMLFAAIAYLVYAAAESLFIGKAPVLIVVKRSVIAVVTMVALFLLFTNAMTVKMTIPASDVPGMEEYVSTWGQNNVYVSAIAKVPFGYGFFMLLDGAAPIYEDEVSMLGAGISGIVVTVLAVVMTALAAVLMMMSLKRITKSFDETDDRGTSPALSIGYTVSVGIGFMVALGMIIFAPVASPRLFEAFAEMPAGARNSYKLYINAQVYVSMILLVAAYIFDIVFKPGKKSMQNADATVDLPTAEQ